MTIGGYADENDVFPGPSVQMLRQWLLASWQIT